MIPAWRQASALVRNRRIFAEEFSAWLPKRILDFHVHIVNAASCCGKPFAPAGHLLAAYTFADLRRDLAELYPGRRTLAVCFGVPKREFDLAANNRYVAQGCDNRRFFAFRLLSPQEDPERVRRDLVSGHFLGIKPYLNYVAHKKSDEIEIADMLPAWAMRIIDELGLAAVLHIPRHGRLADEVNQEQIIDLCRTWPRAKIILAHVGRAYYLRCALGKLARLKRLSNLWYDLAMLNHWEVLEHLFAVVSPDKVLYATDIPIALAPGKSVEINHQYTYIAPTAWELAVHDTTSRIIYTSFAYEELRAIRRAAERLGLDRAYLRGLFFDNGMALLRPIRQQKRG